MVQKDPYYIKYFHAACSRMNQQNSKYCLKEAFNLYCVFLIHYDPNLTPAIVPSSSLRTLALPSLARTEITRVSVSVAMPANS